MIMNIELKHFILFIFFFRFTINYAKNMLLVNVLNLNLIFHLTSLTFQIDDLFLSNFKNIHLIFINNFRILYISIFFFFKSIERNEYEIKSNPKNYFKVSYEKNSM